jgi:hypothetical protein
MILADFRRRGELRLKERTAIEGMNADKMWLLQG